MPTFTQYMHASMHTYKQAHIHTLQTYTHTYIGERTASQLVNAELTMGCKATICNHPDNRCGEYHSGCRGGHEGAAEDVMSGRALAVPTCLPMGCLLMRKGRW